MPKRDFQQLYKVLINTYDSNNWKDTRVWGFVAFGVVVVLATWSGIRVIETNYELQKDIAELRQQTEIMRLQNENLKLQNEYLQTDTYLELSARRQFSKAAPGEKLILVPKDIALRHAPAGSSASDSDNQKQASDVDSTPRYIRNLRAWRDFVFNHTLH